MSVPPTPIKESVHTLKEAKRWREAIQKLEQEDNQNIKNPMVILRNMRIEAFDDVSEMQHMESNKPCPPEVSNPFPDLHGKLAEIDAKDLTIETLAGAIKYHGSLIVRNLLDSDLADALSQDIEKVLESANTFEEDKKGYVSNEWYAPLPHPSEKMKPYYKKTLLRNASSSWTCYSPKMTNKLIALFTSLGLKPLLEEYFNDKPCLSIKKWVLRKAIPIKGLADWHQDGAFMGKDIKSLNLWMALSDCGKGTNRPGMDILPKRLNHIVPPGEHGARFVWSVSHNYIRDHFDVIPERPTFNKGDAIFFDHFNLHVTSFSETFTDPRYAIETWFFGQSSCPTNQIPIVW